VSSRQPLTPHTKNFAAKPLQRAEKSGKTEKRGREKTLRGSFSRPDHFLDAALPGARYSGCGLTAPDVSKNCRRFAISNSVSFFSQPIGA
jgi:hypothetical protein